MLPRLGVGVNLNFAPIIKNRKPEIYAFSMHTEIPGFLFTFRCSTLQTIPIGNSYVGREKFSTMTAKCGDYAFVGILCTCEPKSCNCLVKIKRVYAQHPNDDNYGINCVRLALEQGASPQVKVQCGTR